MFPAADTVPLSRLQKTINRIPTKNDPTTMQRSSSPIVPDLTGKVAIITG